MSSPPGDDPLLLPDLASRALRGSGVLAADGAELDGTVARLEVHGTVVPDPAFLEGLTADLAALENGGDVVTCSDQLYSSPRNLISPGLPGVTGDGWQTRRRREPGSEWVIIRLAGQAVISVAEIDTYGSCGNGPDAASLTGRDETRSGWNVLLESVSLRPDTLHRFRLPDSAPVTHVRLNLFPGGGLARLRLLGPLTGAGGTRPPSSAGIRRRWSRSRRCWAGLFPRGGFRWRCRSRRPPARTCRSSRCSAGSTRDRSPYR
jgi:hypothetical protein